MTPKPPCAWVEGVSGRRDYSPVSSYATTIFFSVGPHTNTRAREHECAPETKWTDEKARTADARMFQSDKHDKDVAGATRKGAGRGESVV